MPATPVYNLPYPQSSDPPDGPTQIQALATEVEAELVRVDAAVATNTAEVAARSRGAVAYAAIGGSADVGTTETITDTVTFTALAGRAYKVSVLTPVLDNQATAAQTAVITIRHGAGATVTAASAIAGKAVVNTPGATGSSTPGSAAESTALVGFINGPAAGAYAVGIGLAATSASSTIRFLASGTSGPTSTGTLLVEDVGPAL